MDFETFGTDGHEDDLPHGGSVTDSTPQNAVSSINDCSRIQPYASAPLILRHSQRDTAQPSDTVSIYPDLAAEGARIAATMAQPYPVAFTRELQRRDELLTAIADWRAHTGQERGRDRRYAMRLLAAERRRRDASRAALHAAARRTAA